MFRYLATPSCRAAARIWLGSLIRLLEPLELNERLIRTSVFRLAKEEWLCSEPAGRRTDSCWPRPASAALPKPHAISTPRALQWDRRWRLIMLVGELAGKPREQLKRALFWQGFGMLGSDCFVHPSVDLTNAFDALIADGLGELLGRLKPLIAADTPTAAPPATWTWCTPPGTSTTWPPCTPALSSATSRCWRKLRADSEHALDEESAFLLRILLIHDYRRLLLRDPELPDVLLPGDWPGHQARQLCREIYHRLLPA